MAWRCCCNEAGPNTSSRPCQFEEQRQASLWLCGEKVGSSSLTNPMLMPFRFVDALTGLSFAKKGRRSCLILKRCVLYIHKCLDIVLTSYFLSLNLSHVCKSSKHYNWYKVNLRHFEIQVKSTSRVDHYESTSNASYGSALTYIWDASWACLRQATVHRT